MSLYPLPSSLPSIFPTPASTLVTATKPTPPIQSPPDATPCEPTDLPTCDSMQLCSPLPSTSATVASTPLPTLTRTHSFHSKGPSSTLPNPGYGSAPTSGTHVHFHLHSNHRSIFRTASSLTPMPPNFTTPAAPPISLTTSSPFPPVAPPSTATIHKVEPHTSSSKLESTSVTLDLHHDAVATHHSFAVDLGHGFVITSSKLGSVQIPTKATPAPISGFSPDPSFGLLPSVSASRTRSVEMTFSSIPSNLSPLPVIGPSSQSVYASSDSSTTPEPTVASHVGNPSSQRNPITLMVGTTIGGIVALLLGIVVLLCIRWQRRHTSSDSASRPRGRAIAQFIYTSLDKTLGPFRSLSRSHPFHIIATPSSPTIMQVPASWGKTSRSSSLVKFPLHAEYHPRRECATYPSWQVSDPIYRISSPYRMSLPPYKRKDSFNSARHFSLPGNGMGSSGIGGPSQDIPPSYCSGRTRTSSPSESALTDDTVSRIALLAAFPPIPPDFSMQIPRRNM